MCEGRPGAVDVRASSAALALVMVVKGVIDQLLVDLDQESVINTSPQA